MVASRFLLIYLPPYYQVSIPFIAGQWSLQWHPDLVIGEILVSIPFIAGQWSLHLAVPKTVYLEWQFQSPSLRGSGRFPTTSSALRPIGLAVSIPFIAGQWSLRGDYSLHDVVTSTCFNPLHCGAVVASSGRECRLLRERPAVSIPFIAGQWSLPAGRAYGRVFGRLVSIPFIAGQWSLLGVSGPSPAAQILVSIPFIAGQWSLLPRTTPSSLFGVLLRKRRLPCDHIICTRLPF